jgi:hypothetical protein
MRLFGISRFSPKRRSLSLVLGGEGRGEGPGGEFKGLRVQRFKRASTLELLNP